MLKVDIHLFKPKHEYNTRLKNHSNLNIPKSIKQIWKNEFDTNRKIFVENVILI